MRPILLDTNVLSELVRRRPDPGVTTFVGGVASPLVSVLTLHELTYGAARREDPVRRERLMAWIDVGRGGHRPLGRVRSRVALVGVALVGVALVGVALVGHPPPWDAWELDSATAASQVLWCPHAIRAYADRSRFPARGSPKRSRTCCISDIAPS